jgi:hypothetical protein
MLHVATQDIWLAILMIMAGVKQPRHESLAIHVIRSEELESPHHN